MRLVAVLLLLAFVPPGLALGEPCTGDDHLGLEEGHLCLGSEGADLPPSDGNQTDDGSGEGSQSQNNDTGQSGNETEGGSDSETGGQSGNETEAGNGTDGTDNGQDLSENGEGDGNPGGDPGPSDGNETEGGPDQGAEDVHDARRTSSFGGSARDADRDGVSDGNDNCPAHANRDQSDRDDDGIGDPCDATPEGDPVPEDPPIDWEPALPRPEPAQTAEPAAEPANDTSPASINVTADVADGPLGVHGNHRPVAQGYQGDPMHGALATAIMAAGTIMFLATGILVALRIRRTGRLWSTPDRHAARQATREKERAKWLAGVRSER